MIETDVHRQLDLIRRGADRIIDEDELKGKIENSIRTRVPLVIKLGVDPTAPDLHLGHTVIFRKLRHFQEMGHQAVFLIGDFTGRIGDPTGRDKSRPPLSEESVRLNARTYQQQISALLDTTSLKIVFNSSWLKALTFEDVVRLTSLTTVARLLDHNTFRVRFEQAESIRMNELLYPFMQAYDSFALKADVELGGTDQTFNLTFGRDLQRALGQNPQVCLTMPILPGTDGKQKMSKSLGNYVGVNESPYIMFEKLMRMVDENIVPYFLLLTNKPAVEISDIEVKLCKEPSTEYILGQKSALAFSIVSDFHGLEAARLAKDSYGQMDKEGVAVKEIPRVECDEKLSIPVVRLLMVAGRASSKNEARRLIQQGAVTVDNMRIDNLDQRIDIGHEVVMRVGKTYLGRLRAV